MRAFPIALPLALVLSAGLTGCAAKVCRDTKTNYEAFQSRTATTAAPHVRMSVPMASLDRLLATEVKKLKPMKLPLPKVGGISAGSVTARVQTVRVREAPAGKLGFGIRVGLFSGKSKILDVDLLGDVKPIVDTKAGVVRASLGAGNVAAIKPRLGPSGTKQLGDFLWKQIPPAARAFTNKKQVTSIAGKLAKQVLPQVAEKIRRDLPQLYDEVTEVEIELPPVPIKSATVRTQGKYVDVLAHANLPVSQGVTNVKTRDRASHKDAIELRLSGAAAAELANELMREGEIPDRYNRKGEPDARGDLRAALGWSSGKKPLKIHLWQWEGDCAHVRMGATPGLKVQQTKLVLSTNDASIEKVDGTAKVKAGIWFSGLGRKSFEMVEEVAGHADFEVGGQKMRAEARTAKVVGDDIVLTLALTNGGSKSSSKSKGKPKGRPNPKSKAGRGGR